MSSRALALGSAFVVGAGLRSRPHELVNERVRLAFGAGRLLASRRSPRLVAVLPPVASVMNGPRRVGVDGVQYLHTCWCFYVVSLWGCFVPPLS